VPHVEQLQIGQQEELGRKRREPVAADLKEHDSGQIMIQSRLKSHIDPLERRQVRNFARQRAKLVVEEVELL
jgi:hypothetical protein